MSSYEYILSPMAAWLIAQVAKAVIYTINTKQFDVGRLLGDGGMPSSHSACVTALAITCLLCFGFTSIYFALAAVFALVVMHDASGIRMESGKQAKAINDLHERLQALLEMQRHERLEEFLGHTPFQVLIGSITGATVALLLHYVIL